MCDTSPHVKRHFDPIDGASIFVLVVLAGLRTHTSYLDSPRGHLAATFSPIPLFLAPHLASIHDFLLSSQPRVACAFVCFLFSSAHLIPLLLLMQNRLVIDQHQDLLYPLAHLIGVSF